MKRKKSKWKVRAYTIGNIALILLYLYFCAYTIAMGVTYARWDSGSLRVYTGYCTEFYDQEIFRNVVTKFRLDNGDVLRIDSGVLMGAEFHESEFHAVME